MRQAAVGIPRLADVDDLVVVLHIRLRQIEHRLGLQRPDKRRAQPEQQRAVQVCVFGGRNLRALLRALEPQLPLVLALMQIAEVGRQVRSLERLIAAVVRRNRGPIRRHRELRIRPQIRRDLLRLHLVHVRLVGLQHRVGRLELRLHLLPGQTGRPRLRGQPRNRRLRQLHLRHRSLRQRGLRQTRPTRLPSRCRLLRTRTCGAEQENRQHRGPSPAESLR